jgi:hypothetical protein
MRLSAQSGKPLQIAARRRAGATDQQYDKESSRNSAGKKSDHYAGQFLFRWLQGLIDTTLGGSDRCCFSSSLSRLNGMRVEVD